MSTRASNFESSASSVAIGATRQSSSICPLSKASSSSDTRNGPRCELRAGGNCPFGATNHVFGQAMSSGTHKERRNLRASSSWSTSSSPAPLPARSTSPPTGMGEVGVFGESLESLIISTFVVALASTLPIWSGLMCAKEAYRMMILTNFLSRSCSRLFGSLESSTNRSSRQCCSSR